MSSSDEENTFNLSKETSTLIKPIYFSGSRNRNTTITELSIVGREFVLLLVSYELNFEIKKLDYYFRVAKKVEQLFHIPGWKLILPDVHGYTKISIRRKILKLAILFKSELDGNLFTISKIQANFLNKAYNSLLWE